MGFFSKKITTDKIIWALIEFFDMNYSSLISKLKDLLEEGQKVVNEKQNEELLTIPMMAITRSVLAAFGDTPEANHIIGKFQHDIFNKYFKNEEERKQFRELFWKRSDEYSKILNSENENLVIQFGKIFCTHFFGKKEDGSHLALMTLVGGLFFTFMINTKEFLDEITSKFEII